MFRNSRPIRASALQASRGPISQKVGHKVGRKLGRVLGRVVLGALALLSALVLALSGAVLAGLWLGLEPTPRVPPAAPASVDDIGRALDLLRGHDPRGRLPGIQRSVTLTPRDLALLVAQIGRHLGEPGVLVRLQSGSARLQLSLPVPANRFGRWLNIDAQLRETAGLPTLQHLAIGRLQVPGWLAEAALPPLLALADVRKQADMVRRLVSHVALLPQQLTVTYALPANPQQELAIGLLAPDDQVRLQVYSQRLAELSARLATTGPVSLARLLPPVFALARERSPDNATAARENRAALMALAFLVNDQALPGFLADLPGANPARPLKVTLLGRHDTPQHFLISAALSAKGGGALANAIGLYKEVSDSQGGSGFSFNDLAADRAGTRLGLLAVGDPLAFQARLAAGVIEADLMPAVADLPEAMNAREFRNRFGGVGAPAYRQMMDDIEARLNGLSLLQPPP
jgi:hypothetical protein